MLFRSVSQSRYESASFYGVHIPVLYFNSGVHTDYHTPFDRSDKINADGEVEIVVFVSQLTSFSS